MMKRRPPHENIVNDVQISLLYRSKVFLLSLIAFLSISMRETLKYYVTKLIQLNEKMPNIIKENNVYILGEEIVIALREFTEIKHFTIV